MTEFEQLNENLRKYSSVDEYLDIRQNPDGSFTTSPPRERDQRTGEVYDVNPVTGERVQTELPFGRTPSLVERLLGTMPSTGFFIPQNDYTGVSGTITRKGAHIAVANELEKIKFVAGTFGGMQNRVAIIRYWCKGDKCTQKATVASEAVDSPAQASVPDKSAQEVGNLSFQPGSFALPENFRGIASSQTRQVFPLLPITTGVREAQPQAPAPAQQPAAPAQQPAPSLQNTGPVLSATPGARSAITTSPTEAAWQFLFNPEELQLESGPEFNRAETWGVSEPANSGQPLAWRFNKNRKLIFGKVLLTGYVLGRRVDSLEKGLQQLFMARSGPGMDGPPVLEFVWGSRVFGPCVIQNLRVRERAWDEGYLVNAEVSFDLEQVPEWTINDGAVDIARPGRQSLVNDPFLPRAEPEQPGSGAGASTTPPPQNQPGGGGGKPTSTVTPSLQAKCQAAYKKQGEFAGLAGKLRNFRIQATQISQITSPFESLDSYRKRVLSAITGPYLKEYGDLHREASSLVGDGFTFRVGGYYSPTTLSVRVSSFAANKTKSIEDVAAEIRIAAQKAQAASKNVVDSECKEVIKPNR